MASQAELLVAGGDLRAVALVVPEPVSPSFPVAWGGVPSPVLFVPVVVVHVLTVHVLADP
ncbi:hypothetical protein [Streptomyces sp. NPDC048192]|uniref:hypothetical protein n=1 Tax=unclassified Streptomyces TaxID=2593676 RepID=UPI00371AE02A